MSVQPVQSNESPRAKPQWPESTKELAYQLWSFVAGRNGREVARLLASGEHGEPQTVPQETVNYWAREYGWGDRAARDVQAIAPDLRHQAFSELLFAGLEGAKYLRQVIVGSVEADKVRTQASIAAVDRIGFSPIGKGAPGVDAPRQAEDAIPDFSTMTTEQVRAWEQRNLRKDRS